MKYLKIRDLISVRIICNITKNNVVFFKNYIELLLIYYSFAQIIPKLIKKYYR